jgi:hypothetical protein
MPTIAGSSDRNRSQTASMTPDHLTLAKIRVETGLSEAAIRRCIEGVTRRPSTRVAVLSAATRLGLVDVVAALARNEREGAAAPT